MQKCQDLAGSGEELFFRVLASLKWSVMTIECIDDKTPTPNWLLLSAAEGSSQVDIDIPSADVHLPSHPWNSSHVPPPLFFYLSTFAFVFSTLFKQLKLLNIKGTKASPGEHRCVWMPFRHTPHSASGLKWHREEQPVATGSCLQGTSGLLPSKEKCVAMCSC